MRWAAVGDSLARVLQASGASVAREYYFNDHGAQIDRFSRSLLARALGQDAPEDGYGGQYIREIAEQVVADALAAGEPDPRTLPADEANEAFRARGVELMFAEIRSPSRTSASTSTSTSTRTRCTSPAPSTTPSPGCASSATSSRPTARCGCARRRSATTATA